MAHGQVWRDADRVCLHTTRALADAFELVFPQPCAACEGGRGPLCRICRALVHRLTASPRDVADSLPQWDQDLPCIAAGAYRHEVARTLLAFKNGQRLDVAPDLGRALARAVGLLRDRVTTGTRGGSDPGPATEAMLLVPVPSSARAFGRRGFVPSELLARKSLGRGGRWGGYRDQGLIRVAPALATIAPDPGGLSGRSGGQKGLGARQRSERVSGSMRISAPPLARVAGFRVDVRGKVCLLVDDVATTGASLREARRALEEGGAVVRGAAVVASVSAP